MVNLRVTTFTPPTSQQVEGFKAYIGQSGTAADVFLAAILSQAMIHCGEWSDVSLLAGNYELIVSDRETNAPVRLYCTPSTITSVTDEKGNPLTVKIRVEWMTENDYDETTVTQDGDNGIPVWNSYVLGLNPKDEYSLPVTQPVQTSNASYLTLDVGGITPRDSAETGVTVKYALGTAAAPGSSYAYGTERLTHQFDYPLSDITSVKYFRIKAAFYGNN